MMDMMELEDVNTSSRWVKLLYYLWKIFTCLFLHLLLIAIVVGYCFFGMFMFQNLESQYEKDTKKNITHIRQNISNHIWNYTHNLPYLHKENWTDGVRISLKDFERQLVWSMRKGGWNGNDSEDSLLWTKDGALFYSIIVITTIGLVWRWAETVPTICSLPNKKKLMLCKQMVETLYFGFTFYSPDLQTEMKCSFYDVSFQHCTLKNCATVSVDMYPCPPMMYPDLETGEFIILSVANFISGTNSKNSFLYYFQEDYLSRIYPKKLAHDVQLEIKLLDHLVDAQTFAEARTEKRKKSMRFEVLDSQIEKRFTNAMAIRNLRKTYIKFGHTLFGTPVCGLSRTYKIHFCRMLTKNDPKRPSNVFHLGYDEIRCYRRKIFFEKPERRYLRNGYWVMMLKCPPLYDGNLGERPQFRVTTKFLSASLTDTSVFSYVRRNSWGQNIKPDGFVYDISFVDFEQDRRRTKEFMKPQYLPEYQLKSEDSMSSLTSQTSRWSLSPPSLEIIFDRNVIEDEVILLANLIEEKKPYERFRRTIFNINMSSWSRDDVAYLCRQVLLHKSYNLKMNRLSPEQSQNCCPSKPMYVQFAMRDAEWLRRKKMLASECPPVLGYAFQYFVSGGLRRNTVIFYARYGSRRFVFPDSVVIRVNEIYEEDYVGLEGDDYAAAGFEESI